MAKFIFKGDPSGASNPAACQLFGHVFTLGGPAVEVTEERFVAKLSGHTHFELVGGEAPKRRRRTKPEVLDDEVSDDDQNQE